MLLIVRLIEQGRESRAGNAATSPYTYNFFVVLRDDSCNYTSDVRADNRIVWHRVGASLALLTSAVVSGAEEDTNATSIRLGKSVADAEGIAGNSRSLMDGVRGGNGAWRAGVGVEVVCNLGKTICEIFCSREQIIRAWRCQKANGLCIQSRLDVVEATVVTTSSDKGKWRINLFIAKARFVRLKIDLRLTVVTKLSDRSSGLVDWRVVNVAEVSDTRRGSAEVAVGSGSKLFNFVAWNSFGLTTLQRLCACAKGQRPWYYSHPPWLA